MWKNVLLVLVGLGGGFITSAGTYALITVIGIIPRLGSKTHSANRMVLYEWCIILGGTIGNVMDLFSISLSLLPVLSQVLLAVFGIFAGIFIGCLVMSLAENIQVIPIMCRRIRLSVGIQFIIISFAVGKLAASLLLFYYGL